LIGVRDYRHETVPGGPEDEGAGRRRPRDAEEGGRGGLRRVGADHKALPEAAPGGRRRRAQAGARPPAEKGAALEAALPAQARSNPDPTLEEHCELFEEHSGLGVSTATMSRAFARLGLPLKRSPSRPPSATRPRGRAGAKR
jgi:hypothetical protein